MIPHAEGIGLQTTGSTSAIHRFLFVVFPGVESPPQKEVPVKLLKLGPNTNSYCGKYLI